jgi:alpha-beta hydrolase superfamily lysophospholipase
MKRLSQIEIKQLKRKLDQDPDLLKRRKYLFKELGLLRFIENREQIALGDLPLHLDVYRAAKKDPVILFFPGIGTYSEIYCEFLYSLSRKGYNVIGMDPRGHGYSGGERGLYSVKDTEKDIAQVVRYIKEIFHDNIILLGISIGAPVLLNYAEKDTSIKKVICHTLFLTEFPPDFFHAWGWTTLKFSSIFWPYLKVNLKSFIDIDSLMRSHIYGELVEYDELFVWEYSIRTLADLYTRKSRIVHEKLQFDLAVIMGENDEVLKPDYVRDFLGKIVHPSEFFMIPHGTHMLPFNHITELNDLIHKWIKGSK